ncbi:serine hydrolase [Micrococcales bacterium 31B]|nr:serine hydrolase [Micrococcales bacterium 31B]
MTTKITGRPVQRVYRVAALALAVTLLGGAGSLVAESKPAAVQYLKPSFSNSIYRVVPGESATLLTLAQWQAAGSPGPGTLPMSFVKYPWQSDIYAVSFVGGNDRSDWVWEKLTFPQWQAAGYPTPQAAGWIQGSLYYTMPDAPQDVYVTLNGVAHKLTYSEWQAAGSPTPYRVPVTLQKLTWDGTIAATATPREPMFNSTPLTLSQWAGYRYATPRVAVSFPGDLLYQSCTSNELIYSGPTFEGAITFAQWQQMGYRTPLSCDDARNQGLRDAAAYLSANGLRNGLAVRDDKSGRTYSVNGGEVFYQLSTTKVLYAAALMKSAQNAGRAVNATEKDLIWRAITVSDNTAAASLYARIGYAPGATYYAHTAGITGLTFGPNWGDTEGTAPSALDMIDTLVVGGGGLNAGNHAYLLSALRSVDASQRWGTPVTTALVAVKDGWDDEDNEYAMNTVHTVQGANRSYSAAMLTVNTRTYDRSILTRASQRIYRTMQ